MFGEVGIRGGCGYVLTIASLRFTTRGERLLSAHPTARVKMKIVANTIASHTHSAEVYLDSRNLMRTRSWRGKTMAFVATTIAHDE